MANISSNDKILQIGCGSIPVTSILIAKKTGAQIKAIDIDSYSAERANLIIKKKNQSNNIEIINADGAEYPHFDFEIIFISDGVNKLNEILHNIGISENKNVRIIFRKTIADKNNFNLNDNNLSKLFVIKEIKTHRSYGNLSSILLSKRKSNN